MGRARHHHDRHGGHADDPLPHRRSGSHLAGPLPLRERDPAAGHGLAPRRGGVPETGKHDVLPAVGRGLPRRAAPGRPASGGAHLR